MKTYINDPVVIWWLRRDLRLQENPTLSAAFASGYPVLAVFILDDRLMGQNLNRRQRFLLAGLQSLKQSLQKAGSDLVIRKGEPSAELRNLVEETGAIRVYAEEDYTPYARKRDNQVSHHVPLELISGLTVFSPAAVIKDDGKPYTVFSPYSRKWQSLPEWIPVMNQGRFHKNAEKLQSFPLPDHSPVNGFPAGEDEAHKRLQKFQESGLFNYSTRRDKPAEDGTSGLSPYLRFGMLSASRLVAGIRAIIRENPGEAGPSTWLNELIWRDFYQSILFHFPYVAKGPFQSRYSTLRWQNDESNFLAWKDGMTGYPVVDAAMRQLKSCGWMHNRARMITASFLTKDLLINWQEGERWFMDQLVDGDIAANNGGWQWAAGTGTDAAPYFRIFNPVLQGKKFDPHGAYVRRWIPELQGVPDKWIHEPWLMPDTIQRSSGLLIGKTYPGPIVDHARARERTLAAYKSASGG